MSMSSPNSMQIATYSLQVANGGGGGDSEGKGGGDGDEAAGGGEL